MTIWDRGATILDFPTADLGLEDIRGVTIVVRPNKFVST